MGRGREGKAKSGRGVERGRDREGGRERERMTARCRVEWGESTRQAFNGT